MLKNIITNLLFQRVPKWNIGKLENKIGNFATALINPSKVEWYKNLNPGTFIADPFSYQFNQEEAIFVEEYDFKKGKGHISVITNWNKKPEKIIEESYHLSYPFVFSFDNEIYMLPEAYQSGALWIYKCVKFPYKWEKFKIIINEPAVDASLIHFNDYWWLFYTLENTGEAHSKLYIKYCKNPLGIWLNHPQNPVKNDISSSRSAGTLFIENGKLYRPAQDCSFRYGYGVCINEIESLNPETFIEKTVFKHFPESEGPYPDGLHTLSSAETNTLIDGRKIELKLKSPKEFVSNLAGIIKKRLFTRPQ